MPSAPSVGAAARAVGTDAVRAVDLPVPRKAVALDAKAEVGGRTNEKRRLDAGGEVAERLVVAVSRVVAAVDERSEALRLEAEAGKRRLGPEREVDGAPLLARDTRALDGLPCEGEEVLHLLLGCPRQLVRHGQVRLHDEQARPGRRARGRVVRVDACVSVRNRSDDGDRGDRGAHGAGAVSARDDVDGGACHETRDRGEEPTAAKRGDLREFVPFDQRMGREEPGVAAAEERAAEVLDGHERRGKHDRHGPAREPAHDEREDDRPSREVQHEDGHAELGDVPHPPLLREKGRVERRPDGERECEGTGRSAHRQRQQRRPHEGERPALDEGVGERERKRKGDRRERAPQE
jgi:hypothetical protein